MIMVCPVVILQTLHERSLTMVAQSPYGLLVICAQAQSPRPASARTKTDLFFVPDKVEIRERNQDDRTYLRCAHASSSSGRSQSCARDRSAAASVSSQPAGGSSSTVTSARWGPVT